MNKVFVYIKRDHSGGLQTLRVFDHWNTALNAAEQEIFLDNGGHGSQYNINWDFLSTPNVASYDDQQFLYLVKMVEVNK